MKRILLSLIVAASLSGEAIDCTKSTTLDEQKRCLFFANAVATRDAWIKFWALREKNELVFDRTGKLQREEYEAFEQLKKAMRRLETSDGRPELPKTKSNP